MRRARFSRQLAEVILVGTKIETAFIICLHRTREVYGLSFSAVRLHYLFAQISREYGLSFLLYGALNICTDFEEGYGQIAAV